MKLLIIIWMTIMSSVCYASNIKDIIKREAIKNNINPVLALAIVRVESNFNESAMRYEPEINQYTYGLFQILPTTAKSVGMSNRESLTNVHTNIKYGLKYLKECVIKYKSLDGVTCCYNAGLYVEPKLYVFKGRCNKPLLVSYLDKVRSSYVEQLFNDIVNGGLI